MCRSSGRTMGIGASGWTVALVLAAMILACSSGGDESISSVTPCTDMEFTASNTSPVAGEVFLRQVSTIFTTCSSIEIEVVVNSLTDIWTVGFDLTFPDTLVRYDGFTLGQLLKQGSPVNAPFVQVNESSGTLQVTATRLPPDASVDATTGQDVLITLRFSRLAVGSAKIDFNLSGGSAVNEVIQDDLGNIRPASFGPNHGGLLTVPL